MPTTPAGRAAVYADAVMAAVLTLQAQLRDPDAAVSQAAAVAIVDLEKTRMRHDTPVAGTHTPSELLEPLDRVPLAPRVGSDRPLAPRVEHEDPLAERVEHGSADTWDDFVDQVWDEMQEEADAAGRQVIISQEQAETFARRVHAELKERAGRGAHPERTGPKLRFEEEAKPLAASRSAKSPRL